MEKPKIHDGPETCALHCGTCEGMDHHWHFECPDPEDEESCEHPAMKQGITSFMVCAHCPAWREIVESDFGDGPLPVPDDDQVDHDDYGPVPMDPPIDHGVDHDPNDDPDAPMHQSEYF